MDADNQLSGSPCPHCEARKREERPNLRKAAWALFSVAIRIALWWFLGQGHGHS